MAKGKTTPLPSSENKEKNVEMAISAITKQFGEGSIMRLGSGSQMKVETISTGSLSVDLALGVGGLPEDASARSTAQSPRVRQPFV